MSRLIESKAWQSLVEHNYNIQNLHLKDIFHFDEDRFNRYNIKFNDILFDYSKNRINFDTISHLLELARFTKLQKKIDDLFSGKKINFTENRSVMHFALRANENDEYIYENNNIVSDVIKVRNRMKVFVNDIHNGNHKGFSGKKINNIVNIGIGGSDLGPKMVCKALQNYAVNNINIHFVSNIDPSDIYEVLQKCDPETTLFVIASKTFTTLETLKNAQAAKKWFLTSGTNQNDIAKHFIALSTNTIECKKFGIDEKNIFEFWDWVGGRYSMWSSIGISIALYIGYSNFEKFLEGARNADLHFKNEPLTKNIPVIMGFLSIWYNNFFKAKSQCIVPYIQSLEYFPLYLQQLEMESNGKSIDSDSSKVNYPTGQVIFGAIGTNAQHSFFQLLHQGTELIPIDFIASIENPNPIDDMHTALLSNCLAQAEALMKGRTKQEVEENLQSKGLSNEEIKKITLHKVFEGNKPSNIFLLNKISPESLGSLIAFYEHKVFVQGAILNINSFDQWGVELGKELANVILNEMKNEDIIENHDNSTNNLINYIKENRAFGFELNKD